MDLQGQRTAEWLYFTILLGAALPAFLYGWITGSLARMLIIYAASTALTVVLVVPDWPMYNRHPLKWLPKGRGSKQLEPPQELPAGGPQQRKGPSKHKK